MKYIERDLLLFATEEQLMERTVECIKAVNPNLKIGEHVYGIERVWEGKVVREYLVHDPDIRLDYTVPHVERPSVPLPDFTTVKIFFNDPYGFDIFKCFKGYVYPCFARIPHAKWLKEKSPGDVVNLHDDKSEASPYTLTQEDFDKHSYVIFRFILSDK